jgi:elongation factor P
MKAKDVRKGTIILFNKIPHRVMDFHHHTPGNLRAMVQTKLRNLLTGSQTETRFSSTEDLEEANVYTSTASYLYSDSAGHHFMNSESYEEITLSEALIGENKFYLQEGMNVTILTFDEAPIGVTLPKSVTLTVIDTEPELRGATASNSPKPAKTDTGLSINVPAFIKIGEKIVVDTEEGRYIGRGE